MPISYDAPHWNHPFARGSYVEQDTVEHVNACEARIVSCPIGARTERPEFGIPWPMFAQLPLDLEPIRSAMRRFEPRGEADPTQYLDEIALATGHARFDVSAHTEEE